MGSKLLGILTKTWECWQQFWFGPQDPIHMSLFRLLVAGILLVMYSLRMLESELFFFESGYFTLSEARDFVPEFYKPLFWFQPPTDTAVILGQGLLLLSLLALFLGFGGRLTAALTLFLHLSFAQRNPAIIYGADAYASFWLLFLTLARNNSHFNLYRWLRHRASEGPISTAPNRVYDPLSSVALRFVQIQLCVGYAYTGFEKLRGQTWWDGSAVWAVLGNSQISTYDLSFMYHFPLLIALLTFFTLIFEIYFPIAIWLRSLRPYWLWMGVALHLGIALVMGLYFFALLMISAYVVFVHPTHLRRWTLLAPRQVLTHDTA